MNYLAKAVDMDLDNYKFKHTEAEALCASAVDPLHWRKRGPIVQGVEAAANRVGYGKPTVEDWREITDAVNLSETLLDMRVFDDPDGLWKDAVAAICHLARQHGHGKTMRLNAVQLTHLLEFAECFATMLEQTPARTYIRACLATEKRLRKLLTEGLGPGDVEVLAP